MTPSGPLLSLILAGAGDMHTQHREREMAGERETEADQRERERGKQNIDTLQQTEEGGE